MVSLPLSDAIQRHLKQHQLIPPALADARDWFEALAGALRDLIGEQWLVT